MKPMHQGEQQSPGGDTDLLHAYVFNGDQPAFRTLVERHADMVFATALRRTGQRQLAEEATQNVFQKLATKAATLSSDVVIAGWLHNAAEWINTLSDPADREAATSSAVDTLAQNDPDAALALLENLAPFLDRPEASHYGYGQLWENLIPHLAAKNGFANLPTWFATLPPKLQSDSLIPLAREWANHDPAEAAGFLSTRPDTVQHAHAAQEVIRVWAREQPADAARWVTSLPENQSRQYAAMNVASLWAAADPAAAKQWVENLPPSPSRTAALDCLSK